MHGWHLYHLELPSSMSDRPSKSACTRVSWTNLKPGNELILNSIYSNFSVIENEWSLTQVHFRLGLCFSSIMWGLGVYDFYSKIKMSLFIAYKVSVESKSIARNGKLYHYDVLRSLNRQECILKVFNIYLKVLIAF